MKKYPEEEPEEDRDYWIYTNKVEIGSFQYGRVWFDGCGEDVTREVTHFMDTYPQPPDECHKSS